MCKQTLHLICSFMCTQLNHQCTMLQSLHVGSFWFKFNNYSRLQLFVNSTSDYNGDLNTGLVWYSKVIWMQEWIWSNFQITIWTGIQMGVCILEHHFYIKFSNLFVYNFFVNSCSSYRTHLNTKNLNTGQLNFCYSDVSLTWMFLFFRCSIFRSPLYFNL